MNCILAHPKIAQLQPILEDCPPMIEALRAVRYGVTDLALASQWYSQLFDLEPYLNTDTVVRYFVDGSWLDLTLESPNGQGAIVAYWGVDNLRAELVRLHQIGVIPHAPPALVDAITQTATFLDPFGNAVGIMEVNDPGVLRARSQRVAEKVALRNVREALDEMGTQEVQQRKANRFVLAALLVALLVATAVGTIALLRHKTDRLTESKIVIPIGGVK